MVHKKSNLYLEKHHSWIAKILQPQLLLYITTKKANLVWGKKHLFIDLKTEEGAEQVRKLASESDVILSNYRTGQAERFGLDYESIKKSNSTVIYGHISGFGDDGYFQKTDFCVYDQILTEHTCRNFNEKY